MKWLKKLLSLLTGGSRGTEHPPPQESRHQIHEAGEDTPQVAKSRQQIHDTDL